MVNRLADKNVDMPLETIQLAPHTVTVLERKSGKDKQGANG
jgi:hypothetical protein